MPITSFAGVLPAHRSACEVRLALHWSSSGPIGKRPFRDRRKLLALCKRLIVVSVFIFTQQALAQNTVADLRLRLESIEGLPVAGALVGLLGASGGVVVEGMTDERGLRLLRAPPGTYRVRVRRIGYRPFVSDEIAVPRANELLLRVESARVSLAAVMVEGKTDCKQVGPADQKLGVVWEEIAKALRASQVTIEDLKGIAKALTHRERIALGGAIISSDTSLFVVETNRPFGSQSPSSLASHGYVRGDERNGWHYFGPDETVLLSPSFAETHCFRLVTDKTRSDEIGVAFEPLPKRKIADIAGVMWVDRQTAELREVTFRYVNAGLLSRFKAGGYTRFRRLPSGAWIVNEWRLRVPSLEIRRGALEAVSEIGYVEHGGAILSSDQSSVRIDSLANVTGVVYDSVTNRPLSGAKVFLSKTSAIADRSGRFSFSGIPTGKATVSFSHSGLHAFGVIALQQVIEVKQETTEVILATPSLRTIWRRICSDSAATDFRPDRAILHGFVRQQNGDPVSNALVEIHWTERAPQTGLATTVARLRLRLVSDMEGHYVACGFRPLSRGTAVATKENVSSFRRQFDFESSLLARRDLEVLPISRAPPRDEIPDTSTIESDSTRALGISNSPLDTRSLSVGDDLDAFFNLLGSSILTCVSRSLE